jgi:hypothetical protein
MSFLLDKRISEHSISLELSQTSYDRVEYNI